MVQHPDQGAFIEGETDGSQRKEANAIDRPQEISYRAWDERVDNASFLYGRRPAKSILAEVRPLTAAYAGRLWRWVFPTSRDVLPLVAKDNEKGWLKEVLDSDPLWYGWPGNSSLTEHFCRLFPWPEDDRVFFLVRHGIGYETPWRVHVAHSASFPGWYEEGLLLHPTEREVAVFWEVSAIFFGRRSKRRLSMGNSCGEKKSRLA